MTEDGKKSLGCFVSTVGIVCLLIWGGFKLFSAHPYTGKISSKSWSRSIHLEEYRTVQEQGENVPAGGRVLNSWDEQYISCYVHVTKHISIPVYSTRHMHAWNIERWLSAGDANTNGSAEEPYWYSRTPSDKERETGRYEEYKLHVLLDDTSDPYTYMVAKDIWDSYPTQTAVVAEISTARGVVSIRKMNAEAE